MPSPFCGSRKRPTEKQQHDWFKVWHGTSRTQRSGGCVACIKLRSGILWGEQLDGSIA
jgi:hypothetical protein